jgi:hypothetical protein
MIEIWYYLGLGLVLRYRTYRLGDVKAVILCGSLDLFAGGKGTLKCSILAKRISLESMSMTLGLKGWENVTRTTKGMFSGKVYTTQKHYII